MNVERFLNTLTERQQLVVERRAHGWSLHSIGHELGLGTERIRQILARVRRRAEMAQREERVAEVMEEATAAAACLRNNAKLFRPAANDTSTKPAACGAIRRHGVNGSQPGDELTKVSITRSHEATKPGLATKQQYSSTQA